jgi:hypothetical protein
MKKWFENFDPRRLDRAPFRMQRFRPGVLVPDGEENEVEVPANLSISVTKQGSEPAKVTVQRGDDSWETTEDKLDALPDDVRPHVKRLLGKGVAIELELGGDAWKWIPNEVRELPQIKRHLQMTPVPPGLPNVPMQQMERRMRQQLQQMRRSLDQMQQELDGLHSQQDNGPSAEAVPVKPDKTDAPKKDKKKQ